MKTTVLCLYFICMLYACHSKEEGIEISEKSLTEAVYASGTVRAASEIRVISQSEGVLSSRKVEEGDSVYGGQLMFTLENRAVSARREAAGLALKISKENISAQSAAFLELEALCANTRNRLSFDSLQYQRYKNLFQQDAVSRLELEKFKLTYENTYNEYQMQLSRLEQLKNRMQLEWAQAKAGDAQALEEESLSRISSPGAGKVLRILKDPGELVRRGEEIALLAQSEGFILRVSIDEQDIRKVEPGQKIKVKLDAWPEDVFDAIVHKVYPLINSREQSVQVDAIFDPMPAGLISGMAAEANIIIRQKEKVQVIPRMMLFGKDSLWIIREGNKQKVRIEIGIETLEEVEVLSGLMPGDKLVLTGE